MNRHLPFALLATLTASLAAQSSSHPQSIDSGWRSNPSATAKVVFRHSFHVAGAPWLQLRFGHETNLPTGTTLRIHGTRDGLHQVHEASSLRNYQNWTAGFNGDRVLLELVAAPRTTGNRVTVDNLLRGILPRQVPSTICGPTDDRTPVTNPRVGRTLDCSGFLAGYLPFYDGDLMISADICQGSAPPIIEFNVPPSQANGMIVRAAPQDQYPYTIFRSESTSSSSWQVCIVRRNSTTRRLPTEVNGGLYYDLGTVPTNFETVAIAGYGRTTPANTRSQTLQRGTGPMVRAARSTVISYQVDTEVGLAGAPVVRQSTGKVIAIHGYRGCTSTGGSNSGTRIDFSTLVQALADVRLAPAIYANYGSGCSGSATAPNQCVSLNRRGGTLTNVSAGGALFYVGETKRELPVTGISVYGASTTQYGAFISIWSADRNGNPDQQLSNNSFALFNPTPGFRRVDFPTVRVPAGRFFVRVSDFNTMYASSLTSGDTGTALQLVNGVWRTSTVVQRPSYRIHCPGDGRPNTPPKIGYTGRPLIGQQTSIHLLDARAQTPCALMFGISNITWAGGNLPWSLAPIGAPGCDLLQSYDVTLPGLMTNAAGEASLSATLPNQQSLLGLRAFCQWYVIDPTRNRAGLSVTEGLRAVLGDY